MNADTHNEQMNKRHNNISVELMFMLKNIISKPSQCLYTRQYLLRNRRRKQVLHLRKHRENEYSFTSTSNVCLGKGTQSHTLGIKRVFETNIINLN